MSNHSGPRNNQHAAPSPAPKKKGMKEGEIEKDDKYNKVGQREQHKGCKTSWMDSVPLNCCMVTMVYMVNSMLCIFFHNLKKKGSRFHFSWEVFLNDENSQTDLKLCPLPYERSYNNTSPLVFMDHRNKCTYWKGSTNRPSDPSGWLLQGQHDAVWGRLLRNL